MMGMAAGAYAAEFSVLPVMKAADLKVLVSAESVSVPVVSTDYEAVNDLTATEKLTDLYRQSCYTQVVHLFRMFNDWDNLELNTEGLSDIAVARLAFSRYDPEKDVRVWDKQLKAGEGGLSKRGLLYKSFSNNTCYNEQFMFSLRIIKRYDRGELPLCKGLVYYDGKLH
jgi:hypothetical protein